MQSCVLCSFVRCGTSKTNREKKKKKKRRTVCAQSKILAISELSTVSKIIIPLCLICSEVLNISFLFLGYTVKYPLKEEFVQVEITIGGRAKN